MHERDLKEASGLFILINKQASLFLALFISGKKKYYTDIRGSAFYQIF
jgi:hypothetical protein